MWVEIMNIVFLSLMFVGVVIIFPALVIWAIHESYSEGDWFMFGFIMFMLVILSIVILAALEMEGYIYNG